ncbi:putative cytochrome p450 [Hypoxylon sp. EC38]|nr:putative cytochrome p450 [Hypoxylon sp. EC38]
MAPLSNLTTVLDAADVALINSRLGQVSLGLTKFVAFLLAALIGWRLWKFTICPFLHPSYSKEFFSWVLYMLSDGADPIFFSDANGLLSTARKYFNNTTKPFALTVLGMTFYVVTQAKHSAEVYKNTETLSFEDFVQGLMTTNGNNDEVMKSLGVLVQKMQIHQLYPSQSLSTLQERVQCWIDNNLNLSALRHTCFYADSQGEAHIELPLYQWSAFLEFDEVIWKMLYQYPSFLSHDMSKPRPRIIVALKRYFKIPRDKRANGATWLINSREDEAKALGIDDDNFAIVLFHLYFAINTNTRKTVFWLLTYLVHNPSLLESYRQETGPAFSGQDLVYPLYIQDPANCPQVDAIWHETLRLSGWSASVRLIKENTIIGGKLMSRGNRVLVPHRLLHFDESIFGENTHAFRPERWQKENLARSPPWRLFRGGKTMCSGQFLARFSVTTFVATLLRRFNIEKVGNPSFPQADEGRPVLGIMPIKEGHDFNVRLLPREMT